MKNFKTFLTEMYFEVLLLEKVNTQFIENEALQRKLLAKLAPTDMARKAWADVFSGSDGETKVKAILSHFDIPHTPDYLDLKKPDHAGVWNAHVNWMISRFAEGGISPQEMREVYKHLSKFHKLTQTPLTLEPEQDQEVDEEGNIIQRQETGDKSKKFIANPTSLAKWKTFKDLKDFVTRKDPAGLPNLHPSEYKMVAENEHHRVFIPHTARAACELGKSSNWCTTSGNYDYYASRGPIYIIAPKSPIAQKRTHSTEKYQMHFESGQFRNLDQSEIDPDTLEELKNDRQIPGFPGKIASMIGEFNGRNAMIIRDQFMENINDDDFTDLVRHGHFNTIFDSSRPKDIKPEHYKYILEGPFPSEPKARALSYLKRIRTDTPETWAASFSDVVQPDIVDKLFKNNNSDILLIDPSKEGSIRHFGIEVGPEIHKRILTDAFTRPSLLPSHERAVNTLASRGLVDAVDAVEVIKGSKSRAHGPHLVNLLNNFVGGDRRSIPSYIQNNVVEMLKHPSKEVSNFLITHFGDKGYIPTSEIDNIVSYHSQNPYPRIKRGDNIDDTGATPSKNFIRSLSRSGRLEKHHVDTIVNGKNDTLKEALFDHYERGVDTDDFITPEHIVTALSKTKRPDFKFKLLTHTKAPSELMEKELQNIPEGKEQDEFLYKLIERKPYLSSNIRQLIIDKAHPSVVDRLVGKLSSDAPESRYEHLDFLLSERNHRNVDSHTLSSILTNENFRELISGDDPYTFREPAFERAKLLRQKLIAHPSLQGHALGSFIDHVTTHHPYRHLSKMDSGARQRNEEEHNKELELLFGKVRETIDSHGKQSGRTKMDHLRFDPTDDRIRQYDASYSYETRSDPNFFEIEPMHLVHLGRAINSVGRENEQDRAKFNKQLIDMVFDTAHNQYTGFKREDYEDMEIHDHLVVNRDLRNHYIEKVKQLHGHLTDPRELLGTVAQIHDNLKSQEDRDEVKEHLKEIISSRFQAHGQGSKLKEKDADTEVMTMQGVIFNPGFHRERELFTPQDIEELTDKIPETSYNIKSKFIGKLPTRYITPKLFSHLSTTDILNTPLLQKHPLIDLEKIKRELIHPEKGAIPAYDNYAASDHLGPLTPVKRKEMELMQKTEKEEKQTMPFTATTIQSILHWRKLRDSLTTQDLHHLIDAHAPHISDDGLHIPKADMINPLEFAHDILSHPNATGETFERLWEHDRMAHLIKKHNQTYFGLTHLVSKKYLPDISRLINVDDFLRTRLRDPSQNKSSVLSMLASYKHDIPAEEILPHLLKPGIHRLADPSDHGDSLVKTAQNLKEIRETPQKAANGIAMGPEERSSNLSEHAIKMILDADHEHLSDTKDTEDVRGRSQYGPPRPYYGSTLHSDLVNAALNSTNFSQRNLEHLVQKGSPFTLWRMMSNPEHKLLKLLSPDHIETLRRRTEGDLATDVADFTKSGYGGSTVKRESYFVALKGIRDRLRGSNEFTRSMIGVDHPSIHTTLPPGGAAYAEDEYKPTESKITREDALKSLTPVSSKIRATLGPGVPAGGRMNDEPEIYRDDEPEIPNLPQEDD